MTHVTPVTSAKSATAQTPLRPPGEFWMRQVAILEADSRPPDGCHHPSSAMWTNPDGSHGGRCLRAYVQRMRAIPESDPPDGESRMQMALGNMIERGIVAGLVRSRVMVGHHLGEQAVVVTGLRHPVSYATDIVERKPDGDLIGRDLKTKQGYTFDKMLVAPDPGEVAQLYWYARLSGIVDWTLEGLDRAGGRMCTHVLAFPDEGYPVINGERVPLFDWAALVKGWQEAERYLPGGDLNGQEPPPSFEAKGFPCWWQTRLSPVIKGCGYRSLCPAYRKVAG